MLRHIGGPQTVFGPQGLSLNDFSQGPSIFLITHEITFPSLGNFSRLDLGFELLWALARPYITIHLISGRHKSKLISKASLSSYLAMDPS